MARRASAHTKAWRVRQSLLQAHDATPGHHAASPLRHCGSGRVGRAMRVVSTNFVYHRTCAKENFTLSLYILGSAETHPPPAPRRAPPRGRAAPPPRRPALWPLRRPGWRRRLALGPSRAPRPSAHRTSPLRLTPLDCVDRTAAGRRRGADPTATTYVRSAAPAPRAWHTALTTHTRPRPAHGPHAGGPNLPSGCSRTLRPCIGRTAGQRPH